jgi:hypothetical protein
MHRIERLTPGAVEDSVAGIAIGLLEGRSSRSVCD